MTNPDETAKKVFDQIAADNAARMPQDAIDALVAEAEALFADETRFTPVSVETLVSAQQRMFDSIAEYNAVRAQKAPEDLDAELDALESKLVPIVKAQLTKPMLRAILRFHGSPQTSSEARTDTRTIKALIEKGLLRWCSGKPNRKLYTLTPVGAVIYNHITFEEAGLL